MPSVTIILPPNISDVGPVSFLVKNLKELFEKVKETDSYAYDSLFFDNNSLINTKSFVAIFINDELIIDHNQLLNDNDVVVLSLALAGG